jgi:UDP-2-acetamido-3-amino-2,3-dideoxy-glucuronate N-acetyltransferase|tara:strand:- start:11009 stop:11464 length:456 start_codon:yes stop_codon:yes gene_type:complete
MGIMIHETAIVDDCTIGEGTKIWAFSHISSGAVIGNNCVIGEGVHIGPKVVIGNNCKIQNHSILYEGVQLGNNVFIGPNVVTTNDFRPSVEGDWKESNRYRKTYFEDGCSIGANSTIICGVTIGQDSLVGAGSVVTKNVYKGKTVYGNPAR